MVVIGIVGGIASGKSSVAEHFRRFGAEIIQADRIGHGVLREPEVRDTLRRQWGDAVLNNEGNVDRAAVARIVFAPPPEGPQQRTYLEEITHPRIARRVQERIDGLKQQGCPSVVLDAPLLLEAGWGDICNLIVFVETAKNVRQQRALERGWSRADFAAREATQESLKEKRRYADWVINNSGSPEETFAQVQQVWQSLQ